MSELNINKRLIPVTNRNGRIYNAGAVVFNSNSQSTTTTQPEYTQIINGYGFVKASGTTLSYDNITYQPLSTAINTSNIANQNVLSATKLTTPKNINGVAFDGSQNITVYDATKLPLAGGTVTGNLTVNGVLSVAGGSFVTSAQTVLTKDNLIVINSGELGAGVTNTLAGIQVDRGQSTDYQFVFDENTDLFKIGQVGNLQAVTTREDTPINGNIMTWDSTSKKILSNINPSSYSLSGHSHTGVYLDDTDLTYLNYGKKIGTSNYYTSSQVFIPFFKFGSEIANDGNYVKGTLTSTRGATKIGTGSNANNVIEIYAKNSIWQAGSNNIKCYFNQKLVADGNPSFHYFATAMVDGELWFGFRFYNFQDYSSYFTGESSNTLTPILYKKTYNGEVIYNQEVNDTITPFSLNNSEYHNGYKIWNESNLTPSSYSLSGHTHIEYQPVGNYSLTSHTHSNYSLSGHSHIEYQPVGNYLDDTDLTNICITAGNVAFGGSLIGITTADFITYLTTLNVFKSGYWVNRGSWSYASNYYITDAPDIIQLAGATVEIIGKSTNYTLRIHTSSTVSGVIGAMPNSDYIYVNNGAIYTPTWRKIWNSKNLNPSSYSLTGHTHIEYQPVGNYLVDTDVYTWAKQATKPSYTASEVGAASSTHTHSNYSLTGHSHTGIYQPVGSYVLTGDTRLTDARPASDVSAWAKAANKPSYTASEVGAASSTHTHSNYSITGHTHSDLQPLATAWNTSNFNPSSYSLSGHNHTGIYQPVGNYVLTTDTRLTDARPASDVYAWAKATNKPSYSYSEVGAASSTHNHTGVYQPVGSYVLTTDTRLTDSRPASDVYAWAKATNKPSYSYSEVGAASSTHNHTGVYQPVGSYSLTTHSHTGIYQPVGNYVLTTDARLTDARPITYSTGVDYRYNNTDMIYNVNYENTSELIKLPSNKYLTINNPSYPAGEFTVIIRSYVNSYFTINNLDYWPIVIGSDTPLLTTVIDGKTYYYNPYGNKVIYVTFKTYFAGNESDSLQYFPKCVDLKVTNF